MMTELYKNSGTTNYDIAYRHLLENYMHFLKEKELVGKMKYCKSIEIMPYHKLGAYKYEQLGRKYLCSDLEEPTKQQIEKWNGFLKMNGS